MEGGCRPTIPRARLGQVGIVMILSLSHRRQARGGRGRHCCRTKKCSAERCSKKSSVARTRAPHAASPRPAAACQPSPPPPPVALQHLRLVVRSAPRAHEKRTSSDPPWQLRPSRHSIGLAPTVPARRRAAPAALRGSASPLRGLLRAPITQGEGPSQRLALAVTAVLSEAVK